MENESDYFLLHRWSDCPMCGQIVICGKCGMNQCSGGTGELPDGSQCDACQSAYDLMMRGTPPALTPDAGTGHQPAQPKDQRSET